MNKKNNDSASKEDLSPKKGGNGSDSDSDDCNAEDSERDEGEGGNQQNQNFEWVALNSFKDLYRSSPIFNQMCDFGPNIVPLSVVGMYLNYAGNHLLHYI